MKAEILVNNSRDAGARYVGWSPSPARIRLSDLRGVTRSVKVTLRSVSAPGGGQLVFYAARSSAPRASLTLDLPSDGSTVSFQVAGRFGKPSRADGDVSIVVKAGAEELASVPVMVRIR